MPPRQATPPEPPPPPKTRRRRWLRARGRSLEITVSGWLFIGLTLLVGFAAINSGSNLLHAIFGAMLALIIGSGVLSEATLRRVDARRFVAGPVHAGSVAPLVVDVLGTDPRDVLAVSVEDGETQRNDDRDADGRCAPAFAVRVPGGGSVRLSATVVMPRRGPWRLPPAVVATRFPFGLFVKRRALANAADVLVYPRLQPVTDAQLLARTDGEEVGDKRPARAGDFYGLREYRQGDDPRRIHWPAFARTGRPVVREMETGTLPVQTIQMPHGRAGDAGFESAIEAAASVAVALLERGGHVALAQGEQILLPAGHGAAHRRRILDTLAWAGFTEADRGAP